MSGELASFISVAESETLRLADWALPGLEDARHLFETDDSARIIGICHDLGASWVVLKLGREGCVVSNGRRREHIGGVAVDAIDATGAGDCFDGAFATRIIVLAERTIAHDLPTDAALDRPDWLQLFSSRLRVEAAGGAGPWVRFQ